MMTTLSDNLLIAMLTAASVTPPPDPQAGTYIGRGADGAGLRLQLLRGGSFVYAERWSDSLPRGGPLSSPGASGGRGINPRQYRGTWKRDEEAIVLTPAYDPKHEDFPDLPVRWIPVRWDGRTYLVPEGKLIVLCNAYNLGIEPRPESAGDSFLLLRDGDWHEPAAGRPAIPEVWRSFLLDEPISAELIRIDEGGFGYLDIGGEHGLQAGMQLVAYDPTCAKKGDETCLRPGRLKVVCPCDNSARIEFVNPGVRDPALPAMSVGDVVSTSLHQTSKTKADGQDAPK